MFAGNCDRGFVEPWKGVARAGAGGPTPLGKIVSPPEKIHSNAKRLVCW